MTSKKEKQALYDEGIKQQKASGTLLIVLGSILTLTIVGAIVGIPLIICGIGYRNSPEVNGMTGFFAKNTLKKQLNGATKKN